MVKKLVKLVVGLVVLLVAGVVAILLSIDGLSRRAVESAGTYVLGTPTTLGSMKIGLLSPGASMSQLAVANPAGFTDASFLTLGSGALALDAPSLLSDVIRVPSIRLSAIRVSLEQKLEGSNATVLLDHMKQALGGSGGSSGGDSGGGRKLVVDELLIEDVQVTVRATGLPVASPPVTVTVKQIQLKSIGNGGKDPVGLNQLTAMVVDAVLKAAMEAGAGQMPEQLVKGVLGGLGGLKGQLPALEVAFDAGGGMKPLGDALGKAGQEMQKAVGEKVGEATKKADEAVKDAAGKLEQGLGDLLKKKQ
ncbi:MAG: hypothetical protein U0574_11275 [Phycisphaerales bacterium]